jgi:5-(carboxyamino)imidazole ribonucleotide synthase
VRLAVVGGGQLGLMLGEAGAPLGIEFRFLDPVETAPAQRVGPLIVGALGDREKLVELCEGCDAVTYEWEGVPAAAMAALTPATRVDPPVRALRVSQDRIAEKTLANDLGIATAPFAAIGDASELRAAIDAIGFPSILKTRTGGYDGKGQVRIASDADLAPAWHELAPAAPLVLEGYVDFDRELSVIACRGRDGDTVVWPLAENQHRHGILRESRVGHVDEPTQRAAANIATRVLDELEYVGVLCVELFDVAGTLLVNEFAPRVHNSGHWSIEGATTSQFENHVRAVLGLPLGPTDLAFAAAAMLNCVGAIPEPAAIAAISGAYLHDYGKAPRRGRKVGHVTVVAHSADELVERLAAVRAAIRDDG